MRKNILNIVMLGPQGSGKGTQSEYLIKKFNIPHISVGTLLRTEIAHGTDIGKQISSFLSCGEIVPVDFVNKVLMLRLLQDDAKNGFILDGFPRTLEQADSFENILSELKRTLSHVVYLNISDELAISRLSGRRVCPDTACELNYHVAFNPPKKNPDHCDRCGSKLMQRKDDVPDAIRRRLELYHSETSPLIALYRGLGLLREVDGAQDIEKVSLDITQVIGLL